MGDIGDQNRRLVLPEHLNRGQRFLFNVMKHYEDDGGLPCRLIEPGSAGVGKYFALDSFVYYLVTEKGYRIGEEILIVVYTGVAALLVGVSPFTVLGVCRSLVITCR